METLQPKHVCPYLPYKVMAYHKEQESKIDRIVGIYYNTLDFENWSPINPNIKNYKLVLRPLSDLTKEIEVNGEKFVPIEMFDKLMQSHLLDCLDELKMLENNINILPLYVCDYLFKSHFDVFGLIEKGLAIDINTL